MRQFADDTSGPETAETYESPALVELGTLEELTLEFVGGGSEASLLGSLISP